MNRPHRIDSPFWRGRRVMVTGHTGFKGSWLCLWLQSMGARVCGFALEPPTKPNLFEEAGVAEGMQSVIGDVRDEAQVRQAIADFQPEILIHMAAQPLVRHSYEQPVLTYATNVMGTVHVMEAARHCSSVRAIVNVTTDKCYENREWLWGYREDEPMGGYDPYSNSKGCSELVTSAYRRSFLRKQGIAVATARAGNVIGGGDWASDRLVPDILRSFEAKRPVVIRHPNATRPWQHVLEPLCGYLSLAQRLYSGRGQEHAEGWNFGPEDDDARPVQWIAERMVNAWGEGASWQRDGMEHPHEADYLKLDISKAKARLRWRPIWPLAQALDHIVAWHRAWLQGRGARDLVLADIERYVTAHRQQTA